MRGTNNCVFCRDRIITLVAMTSYAHGKMKKCQFLLPICRYKYLDVLWKYLFTAPLRFIGFVLIACFDWLRWGPTKGKISKKNTQHSSPQKLLGDEA